MTDKNNNFKEINNNDINLDVFKHVRKVFFLFFNNFLLSVFG